LNAISDESTSWYLPSVSVAARRRWVAGEHAGVERLLDAGVDRRDVLLGHAAAGDLVDELVAAAGPRGSSRS
jgi:hypothetical protein